MLHQLADFLPPGHCCWFVELHSVYTSVGVVAHLCAVCGAFADGIALVPQGSDWQRLAAELALGAPV